MTFKIFFDNPKDAAKISENIGEPIRENLSIEVDLEELKVVLSQVGIKPNSYSIAEVEKARNKEG